MDFQIPCFPCAVATLEKDKPTDWAQLEVEFRAQSFQQSSITGCTPFVFQPTDELCFGSELTRGGAQLNKTYFLMYWQTTLLLCTVAHYHYEADVINTIAARCSVSSAFHLVQSSIFYLSPPVVSIEYHIQYMMYPGTFLNV